MIVFGTDETLLKKLIGRVITGVAYVPDTGKLLLTMDAQTEIFVSGEKMELDIEAPPWQ